MKRPFNFRTLTALVLAAYLIAGFPSAIGAELPSSTIPEVYADLQQLEAALRQDILPAIQFHNDIVETFTPALQDKFTRDWNGITLESNEPSWIKSTGWKGYWDLRIATTLFGGDPEKDTHWPLIDTPGLIEMITMDLQYLEGSNYDVPSQGIYTDTLISAHFDWFAALYSKDFSSLIAQADKIVSVYVLQHNISALVEDDGRFLGYEITAGNPDGRVSFHEQPLTGYPELIISLSAVTNKNYAQRLAAATGEREPEPPEDLDPSEEEQDPKDPDNKQGEGVDESKDKDFNLLVIILWPLTLIGVSGAGFWLGRRK